MIKTTAWAAALLMSTGLAAMAQTTTPSTATPPSPAAPMAATPNGAVPDKMAPNTSSPMSTTGTAKLSKSDLRFIKTAASDGMAEVQAAQLAEQKSQDPKVKAFAEKMVTDHTANNQQLASLAQQKGVDVPTTLDAKNQKEIDKLSKLDGTKFDKMYMKGQVRDHQAMLALLHKEDASTKDSDLKSFVEQTEPVVQSHLDMAKSDATT